MWGTNTKSRLESHFLGEPNSGCWLWEGYLDKNGYGHFRPFKGSRSYLAHRISWEVYRGEIPEGLCVCHKCDNPTCVNPGHLFLGTHLENMQDAKQKKRMWSPLANFNRAKTTCRKGHLLTPDNVINRRTDKQIRDCLTCHRERETIRRKLRRTNGC